MSRFLVDTQLLLWNVYGSRKLPARVARLFRDGRHQFFYLEHIHSWPAPYVDSSAAASVWAELSL